MILLLLFAAAIVAITAFFRHHVLQHQLTATAPMLLICLQLPFFVGIFHRGDLESWPQTRYIAFIGVAYLAFVLGTAAANATARQAPSAVARHVRERSYPLFSSRSLGPPILASIVLICLAVGVFFVSRIGYNAFLASLQDQGTPAEQRMGFRQLRANSTRSRYVAAGYASQFTGVLLPASAIVLLVIGRIRNDRRALLAALLVSASCFYFVTATGGRKYVLDFVLALVVVSAPGLSLLPQRARLNRRKLTQIGIATFVVFVALTSAQGRLGAGPLWRAPIEAAESLYNRLGGDYAEAQLRSMDILEGDGTQWGRQWLDDLAVVLPGPTKGQALDSRLHAGLFGSPDGSSPLNIWGSAYYNWGFFGGVVLFCYYGFLLQRVSLRLFNTAHSLVGLIIAHLICLRLAFVRDPYSLLLEGVVTLLLLRLLMRASDPKRPPSSRPAPPTSAPRPHVWVPRG